MRHRMKGTPYADPPDRGPQRYGGHSRVAVGTADSVPDAVTAGVRDRRQDAAAVNTAKGRPADQPAGLSVADFAVVAPYLDVADRVLPMVRWLCESEQVILLARPRGGGPGWLSPATLDGMLSFTCTPWLPELGKIIAEFGHLYVSSANLTGAQSAVRRRPRPGGPSATA